jgi:NAD-dependent dihydropyrimidine dehydrogenase PreA subunit
MADNTYMKIPREKIPWFPTIDPEKCTNCGSCLEFCSNGVFEQGEESMKVVSPYNCVVGCSSCVKICPSDAIGFPDLKELIEMLKKLRKEYINISD